LKINYNIKKSILISLPLDVSRFFLNNWIEIKSICFLDKAFCNKNFRTAFLNILNGCILGHDFRTKQYYDNKIDYCTELYLNWLSERNILIKNLCITEKSIA
jgi:hypothetical protein